MPGHEAPGMMRMQQQQPPPPPPHGSASSSTSSSSFLTNSLDASFSGAGALDSENLSAFSVNPAQQSGASQLQALHDRLSFSGFPTSLDNIYSIEAFEEESMEGRRSSMLVRVRGRFSEKKRKQRERAEASRRRRAAGDAAPQRRRALGRLFEDEVSDHFDEDHHPVRSRRHDLSSRSSGVGPSPDRCKVEEVHSDAEEEQHAFAHDAHNDHFGSSSSSCGDFDEDIDEDGAESAVSGDEAAPVEVRLEDKELVGFCGVVLNLVHQDLQLTKDQAYDEHTEEAYAKLRGAFHNLAECPDVPNFLSQKARELKNDVEMQMSQNGSILESSIATSSLEVIREDYKSEFDSATSAQSSGSTASGDTAAGLACFVKQCVEAITILKERISNDRARIERAREEQAKAAAEAKAAARLEAEQEWKRRVSMVRRETERKTKEQLEREAEERIKQTVERVRAEAESDWQLRLREEQKNRRLSAQVKMTLAVERVSKKAEMDKRQALSALAEELEQEKEEATRNAAELARKTAEKEWERKLNLGIRDAKNEILAQLKSENIQLAANQQHQQQYHRQQHHQQQQQFQQFQMQHMEEQTVCEIRRFSSHVEQQGATAGYAAQGQQQMHMDQCVVMRNSTGRMMRNSTGGIAADFSYDHNLPSPISMAPQHLEDSMAQRGSLGSRLVTPQANRRISGRASDTTPLMHRRKGARGTRRSSPSHVRDFAVPPAAAAVPSARRGSGRDYASTGSRTTPKSSSVASSKGAVGTPRSTARRSPLRRDSSSSFSERSTPVRRSDRFERDHSHQQHKNEQLETPQQRDSFAGRRSSHQRREEEDATPPQEASRRTSSGAKGTSKSQATAIAPESPQRKLDFDLVDLVVRPGEVKGSALGGRYREYNISAVVSVPSSSGGAQELRTRRALRYSAARELFHDRLLHEAEALGFQHSFQSLLATFPPKTISNSNSDPTARLRAKSIQTYLLSAYDTCARLLRITKDEDDRKDLQALATTIFADFLS